MMDLIIREHIETRRRTGWIVFNYCGRRSGSLFKYIGAANSIMNYQIDDFKAMLDKQMEYLKNKYTL